MFFMVSIFSMLTSTLWAQTDTTNQQATNKKNLIKKMVDTFKKDSTEVDMANELERNDKAYEIYEGLVIRNITIERLPFGTSSHDTTKIGRASCRERV